MQQKDIEGLASVGQVLYRFHIVLPAGFALRFASINLGHGRCVNHYIRLMLAQERKNRFGLAGIQALVSIAIGMRAAVNAPGRGDKAVRPQVFGLGIYIH